MLANEGYTNNGLFAPDAWASPWTGWRYRHIVSGAAAMITEKVA